MSEEANRSADNLILLCTFHAAEIDATPEHFPADMLRQWKAAQLSAAATADRSWPVSDRDVEEVAHQSFDHHRNAAVSVAASSVAAVARLSTTLVETGRTLRRGPDAVARAWQDMRAEATRTMPVFDLNGERLPVEPSRYDTQRYCSALQQALSEAVQRLEPVAMQVVAEVHAVRAVDPPLAPYCDWIEGAVRAVLEAASQWPGNPPQDDDGVWPDATAELLRASSALAARWRGDPAPEPPPPPPIPPQPEEELAVDRLMREHRALLDRARPWARVDHRPYDADLYGRLVAATTIATELPDVPALIAVGLDATGRLAARVARNADEETFRDLIAHAGVHRPLAAAATLLHHLMLAAQRAGRSVLETEAAGRATELLRAEKWQDADAWTSNRLHMRKVLGWTASVTSNSEVQATLRTALDHDPHLLLPRVLDGLAQWIQQLDPDYATKGLTSDIDSLPAWLPTDSLVSAIHSVLPHVQPADEDDSRRYTDETERLASRVLWLATTRGAAADME